MSSQSLKYGHIIRIKSNDSRTHSYITSKSYTDPKLYFQTYGYEENENKFDVSNYRESLFEVLPTSSFEINDEMNAIKNETKKAEALPRAKTEQEQFRTIIEQKKGKSIFFGDKVVFRHLDSKHYIYGSFECAQSGIGAFKIDLREELSEKLIFQLQSYRTYEKEGDEISIDAPLKIYHAQTQCFLSFCMEQIFLDKNVSDVPEAEDIAQIREVQSPKLKLFNIMQKNQRQREQQFRQYEDGSSDVKLKQQTPEQSSRYEIINQNIAKRIWKFQPYLDVEMKANKQNIKNHDIVYLLHTKDDKYLFPSNFSETILLNKRIDATDPEYIFDGLWEIEERMDQTEDIDPNFGKSKIPAKKGSSSNMLTATYNPTLSVNMSIRKTTVFNTKKEEEKKSQSKKDKRYSLRHLMSGRLLFFNQEPNNRYNIFLENLNTVEEFKRDQKYGFVLLQCFDTNLADGALTRLNIDSGKAYLEVKTKQKQNLNIESAKKIQKITNKDLQMSEDLDDIKPFAQEQSEGILKTYDSNFEKEQLEPTKDASEHGFRIYKVDECIKQIALKIMSSQEILFKFAEFIAYFNLGRDGKTLNMSLLNNVINVLKDLIGFIFGCDYNKIVSSGNSPIALRQRAFDELGMVQLITSLLSEIHKRDHTLKSSQSKASEYKKIRTIYMLGYEVLESMAAYNFLLKIKISKYLKTYLKHILEPHNRIVYKSIQEILDGNELALEQCVSEQYIQDLIDTFGKEDSTTDPADLQFLSRLCLCKNRTVKKNQDAVFVNFYQSSKNEKNKFFFKQDHKKYQIASRISKKQDVRLRTLPELYLECEMSQPDGVLDPTKGHWNYFMQYLNLLADVCVDRNNTPLEYITKNLPLKTLEEFLQEKLIRKQLLHQPFIRLVHHAFVETEVFKQISRITKVKNWNNLGDQNQIPKANSPVSKQLRNIMELIIQYIQKINLLPWGESQKIKHNDEQPPSIVFNPEDMSSLKNVNTFLQILKSTLILGFWPSMNKIKQLVPYMLKILAFDIEYAHKMVENPKMKQEILFVSEEDFKSRVFKKVKQELRLNKPNIVLLVQCKILAAQILDIIIDYQFNIRVSSITGHFRKVQEQEVDLRKYPYDEWKFKRQWSHDKEYHLFAPANEKEGFLLNEQLWVDEINKTIQNGNVFAYCKPDEKFLLVLFEAFIYGNQELTDLILKILIRVTNERRGLLNTFKDIILVAGGNLNKLTDRVLKTRSSLLKLTNQQVLNETLDKHNLWNIVHIDSTNPSEDKKMGTIQELAFLTMAMKKGSNPTQSKASEFYHMTDLYPFKDFEVSEEQCADRSYLIISEKEENNPLNQNLIKSQDHHLLILNFIKIMQAVTSENKEFYMIALHASYNFLTALVWNNIENKNELEHFLAESENHLGINCGCIDFFQEMYKNNKKLVIKTDVTRIVNRIIQLANELDVNQFYHKSKLLDFLRIIIIFDNKGVAKNQNIVMEIISQYQVSDNNQIVYLKVKQGISSTIEENSKDWMDKYHEAYDDSLNTYKDLHIAPPLFYMATFFEIFSGLIEDENKVNIGKCTNMHPHSFLVKNIENYRRCWPVVRHLRSYINKLYYMNHEKETQLFIDFLNVDLPNIRNEMKDILVLITNAPDYNTIRICNPIRYTYLGSYVFLALEECLHSLNLMLEEKEFVRYLLMELGQEPNASFRHYEVLLFILEMLEYLMKNINGRYINKYLAKVARLVRRMVSEIPLVNIENYIEKQKKEMAQNVERYKFNSEEGLFRKNYIFHDNKGFWRHLIDWNAHFEQELDRERKVNALAKKTDKQTGPGGAAEAEDKKRRDYLLEKIALANIQKLILIKDPERRPTQEKDKQEKNQNYESKNEEKNTEENAEMLPKNLVTSQSQRFKIKNERFDNPEVRNMIINSRRKKLVKFIEVNKAFARFSQQETHEVLYKGFAELSTFSVQRYGLEVVGKADVIKTLVEMNRKDPKSIKLEYKVEIIKMLTAFIQKQSSVFQKDIEQWVITDEREQKNVLSAQNQLNEWNCSQFLCSLFENDLNSAIEYSNQILLFGICLLIGKSENVQNKVLEILKKDEKNVILIQLGELIRKNELNTELFNFASQQQEFSKINYSDTYDFYSDNEKIMERKFTYIPETVLEQKEFQEKMIFLQRIFIFLKALCEGSNQEIKNYIREQTTNDEEKKVKTESINFINLSTNELRKLLTDFKMEIIKVPLAIVDFIYEVTQIPCVNNQLFLCKSTSYFHDFAQLEKTISSKIKENVLKPEEVRQLNNFFALNIRNCISCLQGNHDEIQQSLIVDDLPSYYVATFSLFLSQLSQQEGWVFGNEAELERCMNDKSIFKGKILDLFDVATVVVKLKSKYARFEEDVSYFLNKAGKTNYFAIFEKNLLGIEIVMDKGEADNNSGQIEYFPRHSVYNYLSRATRATIMEEINRSTHRDKIIGLINTIPVISQEIDYNFVLDHNHSFLGFPISISATKIGIYQNISMAFAAVICLLMVQLATVVYDPDNEGIEYDLGHHKKFISLLSYVQYAFALIYLVLWLKNHIKLAIQKYQLEKQDQIKRLGEFNESLWLSTMFRVPGGKAIYCLMTYDTEFSGIVLFMMGSTLGTLHKPEWFAMLAFHFMMSRMDVLKAMVASITTKIKLLGMLSLLATAFIIIFSIFCINYYVDSLYEDEVPAQHCEAVFDCIVQLYIKEEINSEMESFKAGRFLSDMIYIVFMDLLFGNIVSGVLIDTFQELREKKAEITKDKQGMCFICDITKEILEKKNEDIKTHYRFHYHKLWNYVFYIYNLNLKREKVGLEYLIAEKIAKEDVSWLPLEGGDEEDIGEKIDQLELTIQGQKKFIDEIEAAQN